MSKNLPIFCHFSGKDFTESEILFIYYIDNAVFTAFTVTAVRPFSSAAILLKPIVFLVRSGLRWSAFSANFRTNRTPSAAEHVDTRIIRPTLSGRRSIRWIYHTLR
jgi:hypothetical protein